MTYQSFFEEMMAHMGAPEVGIKVDETDDSVQIALDVPEDDSGAFIGRRGDGVSSLHNLTALVFRDKLEGKRLTVDINGYTERRAASIQEMALRIADEVLETGRPVSLPPHLSSSERKMVHEILKDKGVVTRSEGIGRDRRLTVFPQDEMST